MSLNKYGFQLVIVAEDDNLVDVAHGFHEGMGGDRRIHVEPVEGKRRSHHGWQGAIEALVNYNLRIRPQRHVLLFIDFDNDPALRLNGVWQKVTELGLDSSRAQIHVIGVTAQSEDIERAGASYWDFGRKVAYACSEQCPFSIWQSQAFRDNAEELVRLRETVCAHFVP